MEKQTKTEWSRARRAAFGTAVVAVVVVVAYLWIGRPMLARARSLGERRRVIRGIKTEGPVLPLPAEAGRGAPKRPRDPVQLARDFANAKGIKGLDKGSGHIEAETDEAWTVSFPIPEAMAKGTRPDRRLFRIDKKTRAVTEVAAE